MINVNVEAAMLTEKQDAFGLEILEYFEGRSDQNEIVERDDGLITTGFGPAVYFDEFAYWSPMEKKAAALVRGRVLDIGCGAGRASLYFQNKGHKVTGIDVSPRAVRVCKKRGIKDARILSITDVSKSLGIFDTIVMFGNNFGLFGNVKKARRLLKKFYHMTTERARIIAETIDPYDTEEKMHKEYHRRNRSKGRMGGQVRLRVRYKKAATPWFDYLFVSIKEAREIVAGTGWKLAGTIKSDRPGRLSPAYIMVIEKEPPRRP
jgi:SAM-dependent methyltransferase